MAYAIKQTEQGQNFTSRVGPKNRRVSLVQGGQVVRQSGYDLPSGNRVLGQTVFERGSNYKGPDPLQTDTFSQNGNIYRTKPDGSAMLMQGTRPSQIPASTPKMNIPVPNTTPSSALTSGLDRADVLEKRNQLQGQVDQVQGVNTQLSQMQQGIDGLSANPLQNPDEFLMRVFRDQQPTEAEQQQQGLLSGMVGATRSFFGGREDQRQGAYNQFGVTKAQQEAGNTKKLIADRQVRLREDLRAYDATGTGVARAFSEDKRRKMVSDATAELADLSIIQNAQNGNLDNALKMANDVIDAQYQDYQGQIESYKAELAALEPTLNKEQKQQAMQMQIALDERSRILTQKSNDEKEKRTILAQAAAEGADQGTLDGILKSGSVGEAYLVAGPWIGKQDRLTAQAQRANIYDQIQQRAQQVKEMNFANRLNAMKAAESGDPEAIKFLGYDPNEMPGGVAGAQQYESQKTDIQMGIDAAKALSGNKSGMRLSTGAFQSPLLSSLGLGIATGGAAGAGIGAVAGPGALVTGAAGAVLGGAYGATRGYSQAKTSKDEALAAASFLINDVTFQSIMDLKAQGVTFGQMTEGERVAAGRAASQLASAAIIDPDGTVTGFRGGEDTIRKYVNDILIAYEGRMEYLNMQHGLTLDEQTEAENIWNSNR